MDSIETLMPMSLTFGICVIHSHHSSSPRKIDAAFCWPMPCGSNRFISIERILGNLFFNSIADSNNVLVDFVGVNCTNQLVDSLHRQSIALMAFWNDPWTFVRQSWFDGFVPWSEIPVSTSLSCKSFATKRSMSCPLVMSRCEMPKLCAREMRCGRLGESSGSPPR